MTTSESAPDPTAGERATGAIVPERQRCICDDICLDHCRACNHSGRDLEEPCIADPDWEPDDDDLARRESHPATPDADDASEPLTEAERNDLQDSSGAPGRLARKHFEAVERIKAAAATKARANERERIAQAQENAVGYRGPNSQTDYGKGYNAGHQDRAVMDIRIARGDA